MAIKTVAVATESGVANAGFIYDTGSGLVLYLGILKPDEARNVHITATRTDVTPNVSFTCPDSGGDMIVNVQTSGLMVNPATGAMLNFMVSAGSS